MKRQVLNRREVCFLRHEMPMHQAVPAILLDVEILTVNRREAGKNSIPSAAEVVIRLLR